MSDLFSGKKVSDSRVVLAQLMQPVHANNHGNVHGGEIMRLVDSIKASCFENGAYELIINMKIHARKDADVLIEEKMFKYK